MFHFLRQQIILRGRLTKRNQHVPKLKRKTINYFAIGAAEHYLQVHHALRTRRAAGASITFSPLAEPGRMCVCMCAESTRLVAGGSFLRRWPNFVTDLITIGVCLSARSNIK